MASILDIGHRLFICALIVVESYVVFTIPRMLRIFFKHNLRLLGGALPLRPPLLDPLF